MTLQELQDEVKAWASYNFPNAKPYQPLLGAFEEVGELAHAHLKMEQGIRGDQTDAKKDAIGDVLVYLADYCWRNGLNMSECVDRAWGEVKHRDWIKFPRNGRNE